MREAIRERVIKAMRRVSPFTWCCVVAVAVLTLLISLSFPHLPSNDRSATLLLFLIILAGPFAFLFFATGMGGWVPAASAWIDVIPTTLVCLLLILPLITAHSWKRNLYTTVLTACGFIGWLFLGLAVAFVGV